MDEPAISVELHPDSPTAQWAAGVARSLVTGRLHLAQTGDRRLYDSLVRGVAAEIFAGVAPTPDTNQAADRAVSLVAALVHVAAQLADGWADADGLAHDDLLQPLFQLLEQEGVTF